jgi:putative ABC transport system permease protein
MRWFRIDIDRWEEILITITRNKSRSLLTAFGIFWGIFMLVTLMGGSQGLHDILAANFEGFATNSGFTFNNRTSVAYQGFQEGRWWSMELKDIDRVRKTIPEIDIIAPTNSKWGITATFEKREITGCSMKGVYPEYEVIETPTLSMGRYINHIDIQQNRKVCIIGKQIYETLFPEGGNPCGKYVNVNGIFFQVIGVNNSAGNISVNGWAPETFIIPFTTMQKNYNMGNQIELLCYTAKKGYSIKNIQEKIEKVLKQAHLIHPDDKQAVMNVNAEALFSMVDNLFTGINILSWMVGLGTLIAGAIGVSNIMMVTVKERTTEIGIRRAIGARPRDIMNQILSESLVLTCIAGMVGICFGVFVLQIMEMGTATSDIPGHFQISFWGAIGACIILLILGMTAGLAPAYRAMAIKPIEAIRDE